VTGTKQTTQSPDSWFATGASVGSACFLLALIAFNFVDIDLWHQMALIRESVRAGHLLRQDVYAYTPTVHPWVDHEWGAGAIAYFATQWFGGRAIALLKFSLALGTLLLCWQAARFRNADVRLIGLCAPLAVFLMYLGFFSTVRAQAYTFFFTALLVLTWQKLEQGISSWALFWLAVFPLWVNVHGGFVVGIGLTLLFCTEKVLRRESCRLLLWLSTGMLLESWLTPYGPAYFAYLRRALSMTRSYSGEWDGLWHLGPLWTVGFLAALVLTVYSVASAGTRNTPALAPLAATAIEAALHRKHLPIFAVVWLCVTPAYLQQTRFGDFCLSFIQRRRTFVLGAWAAMVCLAIVAFVRGKPWEVRVPQPLYPVGPVRYLAEQHCRGKLMVPFRLGAYVSWRLYPAIRISLDSRYEEVFPEEVVQAVFKFYDAGPGWQGVLQRYPPDFVLVPLDTPVSGRMEESGWIRVYHDRQFDIFTSPRSSLPPVDRSALSFTDAFP
jgi:hypothetical protein